MRKHVVKRGECLSQIAERYGIDCSAIWSVEKNRHLQGKRRSPDVLSPGDVIHVPEPRARREEVPTEKRHRFLRRLPRVKVRLRLLFAGEPRRELTCQLRLDDVPEPLSSTTDEEGVVEFDIPVSADFGWLEIAEDERYRLAVGDLDPVSEPRGAQQRLRNLGIARRASGELDEETCLALRSFQQASSLQTSGSLDAETMDALVSKYGC